jgi:hypothetical protein
MEIARLVGMAPDTPAWQSIVDDTGELVEAAFEAMANDERVERIA